MSDTVRKTPPYLKALAERRARAAGEVGRLREIAATVAGQLATAESTLSEPDSALKTAQQPVSPTPAAVPNYGKTRFRRFAGSTASC